MAAADDARFRAAWRQWLDALATDASAAIAAAHVYGELAPDARTAWLDALAEDAAGLAAPILALYAPLLAVEESADRRARIHAAIADSLPARGERLAFRGIASGAERITVLVAPLYLDFVAVLACRYHPDRGFAWASHEPIQRDIDAPRAGTHLDGAVLEATPLNPVVEELAHAVLAQRRYGKAIPPALQAFTSLFDVRLER
jgi:hypothetical protein